MHPKCFKRRASGAEASAHIDTSTVFASAGGSVQTRNSKLERPQMRPLPLLGIVSSKALHWTIRHTRQLSLHERRTRTFGHGKMFEGLKSAFAAARGESLRRWETARV